MIIIDASSSIEKKIEEKHHSFEDCPSHTQNLYLGEKLSKLSSFSLDVCVDFFTKKKNT